MIRTLFPAAFLAISAVASAQIPDSEVPPGSRVSKKVEKTPYNDSEVRRVQAKFGTCVVKKRRDAARRYLLDHATHGSDDRDRSKLIGVLADGDCLIEAAKATSDVHMTLPGDTMRYALAEALIRSDLSQQRPSGFDQIPRLAQPELDESDYALKPREKPRPARLAELEKKRSEGAITVFLASFGECVVRSSPAMSRALLDTAAGSTEESTNFAALNETLGSCIGVDGQFRLNKSNTRGSIAMNYYRLASASVTAR